MNKILMDWILACHINGIFLQFPIKRRRTSNLQIVTRDHMYEMMLQGAESRRLGYA
jgi:hypothetical protein